jgi:DNA (cytosine-5)-methyltransferase 1
MSSCKAISLYSGAGGMDIGFDKAGFEIIWSNDIDPFAVDTHKRILKNCNATIGDVCKQTLPTNESIDLVFGGPPCQGFSVAGKMDPNDPRSRHVWNFLGIVKMLKPKAFVMENVKALAENARWKSIREQLIENANSIGYKTKLFVLNASDYGVPQKRERMFLIGMLDQEPLPPKKTTVKNKKTVIEVLNELPHFGEEGNNTKCTAKITPATNPVMRRSPYAGMIFNGQGRPINLFSQASTLPASMGGNRTPIINQEQIINHDNRWIEDYHMHLLNGGKPIAQVPEYLRRITVEEAAAIQTFPKGMHFSGSITTQFRQIGNAVPPKLAYEVAKSVYNQLY